MIRFEVNPLDRYLELGGGGNPCLKPECQGGNSVNVDVRMCHDQEGRQTVDVVADLGQPLPLGGDHFNSVVSFFCLEHLRYDRVVPLLRECHRVLKGGGKAVFVIPNTEAQAKWVVDNPGGWDGKDLFTAASELIFGTQDYKENTHTSYFNPTVVKALFTEAGFVRVTTTPYNPRGTDLVVEAYKESLTEPGDRKGNAVAVDDRKFQVVSQLGIDDGVQDDMEQAVVPKAVEGDASADKKSLADVPPDQLYDRHYFDGGRKVGGYAREGYWDYPVHEVMVANLLLRRPQSVLEVGAARGYVGKRLLDRGIPYKGLEVSRHCYLTRTCDAVTLHDICQTPWPVGDKEYEVSFSVSVLEHIPHKYLNAVLREFGRTCKRHVHAIDFGEGDDGFDRTHQPFASRDEWRTRFSNAGLTDYEILSNKDIARGEIPPEVLNGDGKVKLNLGSFTVMHHHGWVNVDQHDLAQFAQANGYKFLRHDLRNSLPHGTGTVDLIHVSHVLEYFTYKDGLNLLKECRRLLKPSTGQIRVLVPDAELLMGKYRNDTLNDFDEVSDGCANSPTSAGKLWELLHSGHSAMYDAQTLLYAMADAGFRPNSTRPFVSNLPGGQIVRETLDQFPCLSLVMEGVPDV